MRKSHMSKINNRAKTSPTHHKSLIYEVLLWKLQQIKKEKMNNQTEKEQITYGTIPVELLLKTWKDAQIHS